MLIYIKLLLTAFFWGGTFIAGRAIRGDVAPFSAAFIRFMIASIFLMVFTVKMEKGLPKIKREQIFPLILLGTTGVFFYNVFFFKGLQSIEAGRAALIIALNPIFISLLSSVFFKEKLNPQKAVGIVLSVTGAIIVITRGHLLSILSGGFGQGEFYIFLCVLSWVAFSLIGKFVLSGMSPLGSIMYSSVIGAIGLLIPALFEGMTLDVFTYGATDWISLFYLGLFGTVIGFVWYYQGIQVIGPTKAGLFINFVPISAIILGYFILDEPVTMSLLAGALFVSTGVYLTNTASLRPGWISLSFFRYKGKNIGKPAG